MQEAVPMHDTLQQVTQATLDSLGVTGVQTVDSGAYAAYGASTALSQSNNVAAMIAVFAVMGVFYAALIAVMVVSLWKIFVKAGKPGWAAIVPLYNVIVLLEIVKRPSWWLILLFIPFVNLIPGIFLSLDLARKFGKDTVFAVGMILLGPVFFTILAFDSSKYDPNA